MDRRHRIAALGIALWLAAGGAAAQEDEPIGVVKSVVGAAYVVRDGDELPAEVGQEILREDRLVTGEDGALGVTLDDGTLLSMGRRSSFVVEEFAYAPRRDLFSLVLRLLGGTFVYGSGEIGENAPDRVRIDTPFATVATRGTRLGIRMPDAEP